MKNILSQEEKKYLLEALNDTMADYPVCKTIVDLFEQQVEKTPENIAVIFEDRELTYEALNNLSNQLGDYLRKNYGIKPDDLIGIKLERSEWMIVVILGALKSGGAYVPIDPDYPQERIDFMVKDSACKVLIDESELRRFRKEQEKYSKKNQAIGLKPNDLVYCIYTSGSTGIPKGCMLEHGSLVNRLAWMQKAYRLTNKDVILQKTTYTFDVSVWELIWWSLQGASVCILKQGSEKIPEQISIIIEQNGISVMHFVPSMLRVFLEYIETDKQSIKRLECLQQVFTSGEPLLPEQVKMFKTLLPRVKLTNLYGPTEASIDVSYFDCKKEIKNGIIPIGKPIDNTSILVLDSQYQLVPSGAVGEI